MMGGSIVTRRSKSYTFHVLCLLMTAATVMCLLWTTPQSVSVYAWDESTTKPTCVGDSFADTAGSLYDVSIRYRRKLCIVQGINNKFFPNDVLKKSDMIAWMYRAWYTKTSSDTVDEPMTRWAFAHYLYERMRVDETTSVDIPTIDSVKESIYTRLHWYIYRT